MSIEDKLAELTEALKENTEALQSGGGSATSKSSGTKAPSKSTTKKDGITADQLAENFAEFMAEGSATDKKKAKKIVKAIVDHFGAARVSEIDFEDGPKAMELLKQYKDDEDPLEIFEEDGESLV